jgi:hypothetical protein
MSPSGGAAANHARALSMNCCSNMLSTVQSWRFGAAVLWIVVECVTCCAYKQSNLHAKLCRAAESCRDGGAVDTKVH